MVLRCKGFFQEPEDSALNGLTQEEADSPLNSVKNKKPSQKNTQKSKGQKETRNKRTNQMINFILIIHSYSGVNELELFVKQIDGVKSVKGDSNSIRLEVMGKVDPFKIREMVEYETKNKVELIFPSAKMERDREENRGNEAKLKKRIKRVHKNDIANKKTEEVTELMYNSLLVLKIKLCCDSCNQKLCKLLKMKGLDIVSMDKDEELVTVKGTVDITELRSYIKRELKKDVEIMIPTAVLAPIKEGNGASNKKEKHMGTIAEKDKDAGANNRKDKGTAVNEKRKGTGTANEKSEDTAGVDVKHKGNATVTEKDKGNTDGEMKYEAGSDAVGGERTGDGGSNNEVAKHKFKASDNSVGGRRGDANRVEDDNSTMKLHQMIYQCHRHEDHAYGYWREWDRVKYSNGLHQIFSDENPHSCSIM